MLGGLKKLFGGTGGDFIYAPAAGKAIPMSQVNDPTFSQEILGKGVAIEPSEGRITAPADGKITMVFDTKHAISMTTLSGAELIIHVGLDTVQLRESTLLLMLRPEIRSRPGICFWNLIWKRSGRPETR